MGKIIGIDLGTTFSCVAVLEGGKPAVIANSEGARTTPSVVTIKDGETIVGASAKNMAITDPKHTVRSIKRHMGSDYGVEIEGKKYTPQEISAKVLQKLKRDAESYLGEKVTEAVITVPAYFTDAQRQATKDAGEIAGFVVKRIINEPTAAALAYGLDKGNDHTILVFDFGGGTFDVSVLELGGGVFEVKATNGDNHLGGDDIDDILIDYLANDFKQKNGLDLRSDPTALQRLKDASERAKIELSSKTTTNINLPFIWSDQKGPKHINLDLSRDKFEVLIKPILDRLLLPAKQVLKDAKFDTKGVDKVILVGGSTRIPAVQKLVKDVFGKEADKSVNPDEAVAVGAAIQAGVLGGEVKDILLLDVTPLTLGLETLGGVMTQIIEKNTTIPTKRSQIFSTAADNQHAVTVRVLQGERPMASDNKLLGQFDLSGIPPAPRGIPQIEVTFDIDANGIVHVSAKDLGTQKQQSVKITATTNLSKDEIDRMKQDAKANEESDKKKREEIEMVNRADALVFQFDTLKKDLEGKVDAKEMDAVGEQVQKLKELLDAKERDTKQIQEQYEKTNKQMMEVSRKLYEQAAQKAQKPDENGKGDTVVDADFKEEEKK